MQRNVHENRLSIRTSLLSCALGLFLIIPLAPPALAQSYRTEFSASYSESPENGMTSDTSNVGISARYYFDNVNPRGLPYREAAFVRRVSSIGIAYSKLDVENRTITPTVVENTPTFVEDIDFIFNPDSSDLPDFIDPGADTPPIFIPIRPNAPRSITTPGHKTSTTNIHGEYISPNGGWILGGSLVYGRTTSTSSEQTQGYGLSVGKYIFDRTRLQFSYHSAKDTTGTMFRGFCIPVEDEIVCSQWLEQRERRHDEYSASFRHLQSLGAYDVAFGLRYIKLDIDNEVRTSGEALFPSLPADTEQDLYAGDVSIYWTRNLSTTLSYSHSRIASFPLFTPVNFEPPESESDRVGLHIEYFLSPWVSVNAGYSRIRSRDNGPIISSPLFPVPEPDDQEVFQIGIHTRY